jgi:hypothetical protein
MPASQKNNFQIQFHMDKNKLSINIQTEGELGSDPSEMSLIMIKALMDQFSIDNVNADTVIAMVKSHKEELF